MVLSATLIQSLNVLHMKSINDEFLEIMANYQGIIHKVNLVYFRSSSEREENFQEIVYQLWKSYWKPSATWMKLTGLSCCCGSTRTATTK